MLKWYDDSLIKKAVEAVEVATKESAEIVRDDAERIIRRDAKNPSTPPHLANEIRVKKSKYRLGGWLVYAQPPPRDGAGGYTEPYHAFFVEVGIPKGKHKMRAVPYLRPALRMNKKRVMKQFENILP